MPRPSEVFKLNTFELPRRAGEMKEYELDIEAPENVGVPLIFVPAGDVIEVDARLESVTEGVLLSAQIFAVAKGECTRCLDSVEVVIEKKIQELFNYSAKVGRSKKSSHEDELDLEEEFMMDGDIMDLEIPIRDAIVLELPFNPLCGPDCLGLCPECGGKWADLPSDHAHESVDARWAALAALDIDNPDFKN